MASNNCTGSGFRLWLFITTIISGLILLELVFMRNAVTTNPERFEEGILIAGTLVLGVSAGLGLLHQGLANANFAMPMRVALVSLGSLVIGGSLLTGMAVGLKFM